MMTGLLDTGNILFQSSMFHPGHWLHNIFHNQRLMERQVVLANVYSHKVQGVLGDDLFPHSDLPNSSLSKVTPAAGCPPI